MLECAEEKSHARLYLTRGAEYAENFNLFIFGVSCDPV